MAMYGRNGESPMPVVAANSPKDAFEAAFEACRIAIEHMVPVLFLSDGYIANGAEPWKFPKSEDLPKINAKFSPPKETDDETPYLPYDRNENLVREWALPGTKGLAHRIGGLEKEHGTGNVSYDPANHEFMVKTRQAKVDKIAEFIPEQTIEIGQNQGDLLILGWGSTHGVIQSVTNELLNEGYKVANTHIRYLNPFPKNLKALMSNYKKVLIPEINNGQLSKIIREKFLLEVVQYNKIQGVPISSAELKHFAKEILD
jgi:2-oxoglutarate ferredoxin oxidoreductase subunit alpha